MKIKTATVLFSWALICAAMAWWSWATGTTAQKYLREAARGHIYALMQSSTVDRTKLASESTSLGLTPPEDVHDVLILNWITKPQAVEVDHMFIPQTWGWAISVGVCAFCGIACLRRRAVIEPPR